MCGVNSITETNFLHNLGYSPLGEGVDRDLTGRPLKVGDRVFIASLMNCGRCYYCLVENQPALCLNLKSYSHKPFPDELPHFQGAYAQYMDLRDNYHILRMSNVDPRAAVMLEPLACGLHAVDRAEFRVPATVVIQGAGPIGLSTLVAAKEAGAAKTLVLGAPQIRLNVAEELGADITINIEEVKDPRQRIRQVKGETMFGLGADIVFEATGVPQAVPEGIAMVRNCGQYITLGHFTDNGSVELNPWQHFTANEITLKGVYGSHQALYVRAREILESGRYPLEKMVTHQVPLEKLEDTMVQLAKGPRLDGAEVVKVAVVP
jgi:L-iditol 2-dehydrogenase